MEKSKDIQISVRFAADENDEDKLSPDQPATTSAFCSKKFEIFWQEVLGKGAFAVVYAGKLLETRQDVAVKRLQKDCGAIYLTDLDAMKQLDHPNVVKLFSIDSEDDDYRYIVMEKCVSTIHGFCEGKYSGPLPEPEEEALCQMAKGLHYIHSKGLVHGTVNAGNVFIFTSASGVQLKISSDFGFYRPASDSIVVSPLMSVKNFTTAPELLSIQEGHTSSPLEGTFAGDIFSLGCVFFTYLTKGSHPFSKSGESRFLIPISILEGTYLLDHLDGSHSWAKMIIEPMIQADPSQRMGLEQVIKALTNEFK